MAKEAQADSPTQSDGANKKQRSRPKPACFTIMPFGEWFDDYYDELYCPAIRAAGLEPKRADDLYRPSTIINDIWSYTQSAKLIFYLLTEVFAYYII